MSNSQTTDSTPVEPAKDGARLAKFQTQLALDRTTLAWTRTTLTMATFGFGTVGFFRTIREKSPSPLAIEVHENAIRFGVGLVVVSIVATVLVAISHWSTLRKLRRNETPAVGTWPLSVTFALLLAILGLASLWLALRNTPVHLAQ